MQSSRARNRTVMLSPEMTGQVRALLQTPPLDDGGNVEEKPKDNGFVVPDFSSSNNLSQPQSTSEAAGAWQKAETSNSTMVHKRKDIRRGSLDPLPNFGLSLDSVGSSLGKISGEDKDYSNPTLTNDRLATTELSKTVFAARENLLFDNQKIPSTKSDSDRFSVVSESASKSVPVVSRRVAGGRIVGFLISFDNEDDGEITELRVGRWIVTSREIGSDSDLVIQDESISPSHAVLKVGNDGSVMILDQLSEFGTGVIKQESEYEQDASSGMVSLDHGDMVRLGRRYFVYCGVPKIYITE
ncbi:MAG TPA: FHA domain-containing protein [Oligoflexia bacterium]|nr:FHA domain-containing protein [Oligoflexia bacterium]